MAICQVLEEMVVVTRYDNRTHRISRVHFSKNPNSLLVNLNIDCKNSKRKTLAKYFEEKFFKQV